MKNIFLIITLSFLIFSCSWKNNEISINNSTETQSWETTSSKDEKVVYNWAIKLGKETCWEKTCALTEYLEKLEQDWIINIEKTKYFQKRFWVILSKYGNNKEVFLKQPDYQKFVDDFYAEFFPCDRKIEICHNKGKYTNDEQNFIWYIFLPQMVWVEFENLRWWNPDDSESVIQSIRRKYYATYDEKVAAMKVWEDKTKKAATSFDLSSIDKEKLKTDTDYFHQVILTPQAWLFDTIATNCLTPIPWPEKGQNTDARNYAIWLFFSKLKDLWIPKEDFMNKIWTSEENFKKLETKLKEVDERYGLRNKVPSDRFLTHAEIANFYIENLADYNEFWNFNRDALEVKHLVLLQFVYDIEELYQMDTRVEYFNSDYNFLWENVVKYTKYMDKNFKY